MVFKPARRFQSSYKNPYPLPAYTELQSQTGLCECQLCVDEVSFASVVKTAEEIMQNPPRLIALNSL
jgi:hypothetical protein